MRILFRGGVRMEHRQREQAPGEAVAEQLRHVGDALSRLVGDHVELAKAEVKTSLKKAGRDAALAGVGIGILLLGYVLLVVAIALGIGAEIGFARGFLIVSAFHVLVGLALAGVFARRLQAEDRPGVPKTVEVIAEDRRFVSRVRGDLRNGR